MGRHRSVDLALREVAEHPIDRRVVTLSLDRGEDPPLGLALATDDALARALDDQLRRGLSGEWEEMSDGLLLSLLLQSTSHFDQVDVKAKGGEQDGERPGGEG